MSRSQVRGLLEVSIASATLSLVKHAKYQRIDTTEERVAKILCDEIDKGKLVPLNLVRDIKGRIDRYQTAIDPGVFMEYGQEWLCAHGLRVEPGTNDYPTFPEFEADLAICEWLEGALPEIRTGVIRTYEVLDCKPHRVETVIAALICSNGEGDAIGAKDVRTALRESLHANSKVVEIGPRAESTFLNIIGGLLALLLGKSPAGKPLSQFENQTAVIDALLARFEGTAGISERTLQDKFAAANRSLHAP